MFQHQAPVSLWELHAWMLQEDLSWINEVYDWNRNICEENFYKTIMGSTSYGETQCS